MTKTRNIFFGIGALGLLTGLVAGGSAPAAALTFSWDLKSHPDGGIAPPPYGLRLDGIDIDNSGGGFQRLTWDFDHADSDVKLIYSDEGAFETLRFTGTARGGIDDGSVNSWDDTNSTLWDFDILYQDTATIDAIRLFGGGTLNADTGPFEVYVLGNIEDQAIGTVSAQSGDGGIPAGASFELSARGTHTPTGHAQDLFDDNGILADATGEGINFFYDLSDHRLDCPDGEEGDICDRHTGAGWVDIESSQVVGFQSGATPRDWLLTGSATPVPEPGALALFGLGLAGLGLVRRRAA